MALLPDDFETVSNNELRRIWGEFRDPDVRRLILEVHRARLVMSDAHADALNVMYALWDKKDDEALKTLKSLIERLQWEKDRLGARGGLILSSIRWREPPSPSDGRNGDE